MKPLHAALSTVAIFCAVVVLAVVASLLPENEYQRWQLLSDTIHARAGWIYERSRFDPQPVDVVFVGNSRTDAAVSAPRLAKALAARGLPAHVVNFGLPENGRNIELPIIENLLRTKTPKLLVIGVIDKPGRFGHPAFKYLAPRGEVADPGYLGNLNYFSDLIYLPFRQLRLFQADLAPGGMGYRKQFDPARYEGSLVETTGNRKRPDGTIIDRETAAPEAVLALGARKLAAGTNPPILPASLADVEFGDERVYIRRIAALAKAKGVQVAFLALPSYAGTTELQEQAFYERFGPVWNADFASSHAEWYTDYAHMTRTGAEHITDWLVTPVSAVLTASCAKASTPCT